MSDIIFDKEQLKKEIIQELMEQEKKAIKQELEQRKKEHEEAQLLEAKKQAEKESKTKAEEERLSKIKEQTKKEFDAFVVEYKKAQEPFLKQYVDKEEALKFWHVLSEKFILTPEVDVEYDISESTITRDRYWCHLANPEDINNVLDVLLKNNFINESNKKTATEFFEGLDKEPYYEIAVGIDYDTEKRIRLCKMVAPKRIHKTIVLNNDKIEKEIEFYHETDAYKAYQSQEKILSKYKFDLHLASDILAIKDGETLSKIKFVLCGDLVKCPGTNHDTRSVEIKNNKITFFVINPDSPIFSPTHNLQQEFFMQ